MMIDCTPAPVYSSLNYLWLSKLYIVFIDLNTVQKTNVLFSGGYKKGL